MFVGGLDCGGVHESLHLMHCTCLHTHRIACTSVSERKVFLVGHGTTVAVLIYQSCTIAGGVRLLMDGATAQQQQQMMDMLQLRSDELSAENGKLRMRMARGDRQLPKQLHNDYRFSQVFSPQQNERMPSMRLSAATVTHQHALQARGFSDGGPSRAAGQSQAGPALYPDRWEVGTHMITTPGVMHGCVLYMHMQMHINDSARWLVARLQLHS